MVKVYVRVQLKSEILDPQGRALLGVLSRQKLSGLVDVRQGKEFVLSFEKPLTLGQIEEIEKLAGELFSNQILEDYSIQVEDES